ncbi:MAG: eukaryotic-like serine/threonine-protein kinase [Acidobacteriota bacterium]|jgi:serine/threonine protein kinase/tetratricopeptide (TPR) repeat protein|nr:eukaryotic-like serine/threonine-protein kinase [Acidobacteriota bacterium]
MIEQTISHYRIIDKLGTGGMGEVYAAEDTRNGRKVALKLLPAHVTKDEKTLQRFKKEASAILKLNHPNILTIFEIGQDAAVQFIATEYINGETLRDHLWRNEMKIDEVLGISIQVARALEAAHAEGIIHRDIKPENIMLRHDLVGRDRLVKVLDFGLAKLTEKRSSLHDPDAVTMPIHHTEPGTVMGTTGYMSPEQTRGMEVDARTDIFSLGIVLYEMVARRAPFEGPTDSHVKVSILDHEPPPLASKSQPLPHQLERIVKKALAKDRTKRYQTVTDLKTDLENLRDELDRNAVELSVTPESEEGESGGKHVTAPAGKKSTAPRNVELQPARTLSSAEYIVTGVGRHKIAALLGVAALLLVIAGIVYLRSASGPSVNSVAVLPFVNDSLDPNAEYLSDGITESIINNLSQLPNLKVMSRNAVFRYKGQQIDPQEAGRNLGVGAVLTGRVVKVGEKLIIKTELINVSDGAQLWGAEYNNSMSDIFTVQEEISRKIFEKLRVKLTGQDEERLAKRYTNDTEAYQLYLKGRYFWNKRDETGLRNGIKFFKQAEEKDPTYALAYSGLADSYALLCDIGAVAPVEEMPNARQAAERALSIDPRLAEGYTSRAFVKLAYDWDWPGAESDFRRALELNPKYATAHQWYASFLTQMGKYDLARREIEQAQQLDPLSPIINANSGLYLYYAHKYDEAIEQYRKTLEIDPRFGVAHYYLGLAYLQKKDYSKAVAEFKTVMDSGGDASAAKDELDGDDLETAAALAYAYSASGKRAEAQALLNKMIELQKRRYVSPLYLATVYTGLGEKEQAIEQLNKAYENKHPGLVLIRVEPLFDSLRDDQRFQELLRRFEPIP